MEPAMLDRWTRWTSAHAPRATADDTDTAALMLEALYDHPPRPYHSLGHIADCLAVLEEMRPETQSPEAVEFALWTHDAVYDAKRTDNEARSASVAAALLRGLGCRETLIDLVRPLVLATTHRTPPATADEAVVVDIDMSILGASADRYERYAAAIREEYRFADDAAYAKGRSAFLRGMLGRARIYATDLFRHRFEDLARANLTRELVRFDVG